VGAIAGAVAGGQLVASLAGRIADTLFGTSRYAAPAMNAPAM